MMRRLPVLILLLSLCLPMLAYRVSGVVADGLPDRSVRHIAQDSVGYLWFTTLGGTARYDGYRVDVCPSPEGMPEPAPLTDNLGNRWASDHAGVLTRSDGLGVRVMTSDELENAGKERFGIYDDGDGHIWISTYGAGLVCHDTTTGEIVRFASGETAERCLPTDFVLCVAGDRDGNVWAGTEHGGVVRISPDPAWGRMLVPSPGDRLDRTNSIRYVGLVAPDEIWVGNRKGDVYRYTTALDLPVGRLRFPSIVFSVCHDASGERLVGTRGNGVMLPDGSTSALAASSDIDARNVFDMALDRRGTLWLALFDGGLAAMRDGRAICVDSAMTVRAVTTGRDGRVWCATDRGLFVAGADSACDSISLRRVGPEADVRTIYADPQGVVWASYPGIGVARYGEEVRTYPNDMLRNENPVQSITEDADGYIWLGTEQGLVRLDPGTGETDNLRVACGRPDIFLENSVCNLPDGRLLFGTDAGVAVIDPARIRRVQSPVPVVTSVEDDGHGNIAVSVSVLSYRSDAMPVYRFMLVGHDSEWGAPTLCPAVRYSGLRPGSYTLMASARLSGGEWSADTEMVRLTVEAPVWQRVMSAALIVFLTGFALYDIVRWRPRPHGKEDAVSRQSVQFVESVNRIIEENIANADFTIDDFARAAAVSRTGLYNRVKTMMGSTPMDLLRRARMERAATLLARGGHTVGEIATLCGIRDPLYFSRCFKAQFGVSPSRFAAKKDME